VLIIDGKPSFGVLTIITTLKASANQSTDTEEGFDEHMHTRLTTWVGPTILLVVFLTGCIGGREAIPTDTSPITSKSSSRILPTPYLVSTMVRAPIAWTRATGQGVTLAVVNNHSVDLSVIPLIAPDITVEEIQLNAVGEVSTGTSLTAYLQERDIRLLSILDLADFSPDVLVKLVTTLTEGGVAVLVSGDLVEGKEGVELAADLKTAGAITVGRLDSQSRVVVSDVKERQIDIFAPFGFRNEHSAVLVAEAVAGLVLEGSPDMTPQALKQHLVDTAAPRWQITDPATGQVDLATFRIDPTSGDYSPTDRAFTFQRIDAANAVGTELTHPWPVNAINAPAAWRNATGAEVTVAVIDQGFHIRNPVIKNHVLDTAHFGPVDFTHRQNFHGTSMSKAVLMIAPDASLVPVLCTTDSLDDWKKWATNIAEGITHAREQGVDVITMSWRSFANTPDVHKQIDRAIEDGIVVVWFHYQGDNEAVIRPGVTYRPWFEVGIFDRFLDEDKPVELAAGLSSTAPQVAGLAALILQHEPSLSPLEVKQRILSSAISLGNGIVIADALAAVEDDYPSTDTIAATRRYAVDIEESCVITYTLEGEAQSMRITENEKRTILTAFPGNDIFVYRAQHEPYPNRNAPTANFIIYCAGSDGARMRLVMPDPDQVEQPTGKMSWSLGYFQPAYRPTMESNDESDLRLVVTPDEANLQWENAEGLVLETSSSQSGQQPTSVTLLGLEVHAVREYPDLYESIY